MRWIVGVSVVVLTALNAPSTAQAANRCVTLGWHSGGARGLLVLRPGQRLSVRQPDCLVDQLVLVAGKTPIAVTVTGPGWHGTLRSPESRVDGLVDSQALFGRTLESGGHANLAELRKQLGTARKSSRRDRLLPAAILIAALAGVFALLGVRRRRALRA
ncbi:MAG TPA: hypothetical protein VNH45_09980 [Gaiellaceae bacterium]|jgi:hypothetical protein|nr:hypothetical protein [Gaiellaceae bacterium]